MNDLAKRVIVAAVGIPFALLIIVLGGFPFFITVSFISLLSLLEFYSLAEKKGYAPHKINGAIFGIIIQLVFFIQFNHFGKLSPFMSAILIYLIFVIITLICEMYSKNPNKIANAAVTILGMSYISIFFITFYILRELNYFLYLFDIHVKSYALGRDFTLLSQLLKISPDRWAYLIITLLGSIWVCDSAAYFIGKAIGKHKLFERISPKKTIEGAIAGFVFAILSFVGLGKLFLAEIPIVHFIVGGAIVGLLGQYGDLAESMLKRDAGVKDSSNLLPGHGGALDRFDSILFVSPSYFIYLSFVIFFDLGI